MSNLLQFGLGRELVKSLEQFDKHPADRILLVSLLMLDVMVTAEPDTDVPIWSSNGFPFCGFSLWVWIDLHWGGAGNIFGKKTFPFGFPGSCYSWLNRWS